MKNEKEEILLKFNLCQLYFLQTYHYILYASLAVVSLLGLCTLPWSLVYPSLVYSPAQRQFFFPGGKDPLSNVSAGEEIWATSI